MGQDQTKTTSHNDLHNNHQSAPQNDQQSTRSNNQQNERLYLETLLERQTAMFDKLNNTIDTLVLIFYCAITSVQPKQLIGYSKEMRVSLIYLFTTLRKGFLRDNTKYALKCFTIVAFVCSFEKNPLHRKLREAINRRRRVFIPSHHLKICILSSTERKYGMMNY